ncbi:hypothetical protein ACQQ2N_06175 [Dokdonella sp. MW10]|uniref:hypothetical protein n=1 Tax=Dokdonella sp. MW10 TaxID=2992926 RepID=UPI003F7FDBA5
MRSALLGVALLTSGCIPYPVYKTLQPRSTVVVTDESRRPIEDATVQLVASSNPYNRERSRVSDTTDEHGVATFDAKKEWRVEAIVLHGAEFYYWNWCVTKAGYKTFATSNGGGQRVQRKQTFTLVEGESTECPRYGYGGPRRNFDKGEHSVSNDSER